MILRPKGINRITNPRRYCQRYCVQMVCSKHEIEPPTQPPLLHFKRMPPNSRSLFLPAPGVKIPKTCCPFYRLADKSGYPDSSITLIGLDRNKKLLNNLHAVFNVPIHQLFIVMKDGKIGRVVEYGKYGQVDKELGEIVRTIE